MSGIPYFESYNGKRPIVERLVEPLNAELLRMCSIASSFIPPNELQEIRAALTRDAIRNWCVETHNADINGRVDDFCDSMYSLIDHAEVNAAAHALADALGVEP